MPQTTSSASIMINPIRVVLFVCALVALLAVLCDGRKRNCGNRSKNGTNRIINGYELRPGDFPQFISLNIKLKSFGSSVCSGVLIDKDVVLTAAHCVQDYRKITVASSIYHPDAWDRNDVREYIAVRACQSDRYDHSSTRVHYNYYDFAVVILREPVKNAKIATLESQLIKPGQRGTAVGIGLIKYYGNGRGEFPEKAFALPMEMASCYPRNEHESHVCFTSYNSSYIGDICYGDSGGPVFSDGPNPSVLGLSSYINDGGICLAKSSRSVFVNIPYLKHQIEETIRKCRN